jgi:capsular exopolysaccharide synthesis family protein
LHEEYLAAQHGEDLMQKTADATKADAFKQIGAAAELIALQEEVDSGQRLYEDLERKLKESGVLAGLKSTQTDIVVKPNLAARPVEPSLLMFAAITFFFGGIGSISAALLRENSDRTLKNAYEVEEAIQIPVLGQIPHQSVTAQDPDHLLSNSVMKSVLRGGPKSRVAEAFRTLCSTLLLSSTRAPKVILVTSSLPGEGKTSVSAGVATILSQKRDRVLMIEADMRRPTMHRSLLATNRSEHKTGLATVLSGSSTFGDSVYRVESLPGLTVLPSGPIPPYPAELLDSDVMANLLDRARQEFDYIVIDTPPLLSVSDALPLTGLVDAILVVVRSRTTRLHALVDTHNVVARTGARISGVVLNDVADLDGGHYYYGYYNSYYEEPAKRSEE